jgi:hypothetical protein
VATPDLERLVRLVRAGVGFETGVPPLQDDEVAVWRLARDHKVATILSSGLLNSETAPSLTDEARYIWQLAALRAEYYMRKCDEICGWLGNRGIWVTPLKGVPLAREAYPRPGQRVFRDLDLLVRPADVEAVHEILIERGFVLFKPHGPLPRGKRLRGDPLEAAKAGIDAVSYEGEDLFLEIHTRILPPVVGRYPLEGSWSPEDFLVHLLIHATRHHFLYGLRQLVDVAVWSRAKKPDWDLAREKLAATGLEHLAYPTWVLSFERFPEAVPAPPLMANRVVRFYTGRARRRFAQMPLLAPRLSGSPFPFILMRPEPVKNLFRVAWGTAEQADYQEGESRPASRRILWRVVRPFGLLWRHATVLWHWLWW